jgi:UDP-N-acetylglucosamine transferase subunit ALG13
MADMPSIKKLNKALDKALAEQIKMQFKSLVVQYGDKNPKKAEALKTFRINLELIYGAYKDASSQIESTTAAAEKQK